MKRFAMMAVAVACLVGGSTSAHASWGQIGYSGYQPWYNIFATRYKGLAPEPERPQNFLPHY